MNKHPFIASMAVVLIGLPGCGAKTDNTGGGISGSASGRGDDDGGGEEGGGTDGGGSASSTSAGTTAGTSAGTSSSGGTTAGSSTTGGTSGSTSASTTAGSSSSTGGDTDGGTPFVVMPDGGGAANECDVWAQDCPDGQGCKPWANDGGNSWNATKCTEIPANPGQPGDECMVSGSGVSGVDDCDVGSMCWDSDEMGIGTCVSFCTGSATAPMCEDTSSACSITNNGVLILCLPICDPLLQECPDGTACIYNGMSTICVLDASGTMGVYGDPCEFANACDPGLICLDPTAVPGCVGAQGCCSEFCDLSVPDPDTQCMGAAEGQTCTPLYADGTAPPDQEDVGVCAIPA